MVTVIRARMSKLRWLAVLSLISLVGFLTDSKGFLGFMGFVGFLSFSPLDERDEANIGRAALVSHILSTIFVCFSVAVIGLLADRGVMWNVGVGDVLMYAALALGGVLLVNVLSFEFAYQYYDKRGR